MNLNQRNKQETIKDGIACISAAKVKGHQTQPHVKGLIKVCMGIKF